MAERLSALLFGFLAGAAFIAAFVVRNIAGDSNVFLLGLAVMVTSLIFGIWVPWGISTGKR